MILVPTDNVVSDATLLNIPKDGAFSDAKTG